jgi:hypothetical protein
MFTSQFEHRWRAPRHRSACRSAEQASACRRGGSSLPSCGLLRNAHSPALHAMSAAPGVWTIWIVSWRHSCVSLIVRALDICDLRPYIVHAHPPCALAFVTRHVALRAPKVVSVVVAMMFFGAPARTTGSS